MGWLPERLGLAPAVKVLGQTSSQLLVFLYPRSSGEQVPKCLLPQAVPLLWAGGSLPLSRLKLHSGVSNGGPSMKTGQNRTRVWPDQHLPRLFLGNPQNKLKTYLFSGSASRHLLQRGLRQLRALQTTEPQAPLCHPPK